MNTSGLRKLDAAVGIEAVSMSGVWWGVISDPWCHRPIENENNFNNNAGGGSPDSSLQIAEESDTTT
jgi:hypothetical protein